MLVIKNIYKTFQGEGSFAGTPSVFIRTAGCGVGCSWCDTDYSGGVVMSPAEVVNTISSTIDKPKHIVITGGEPLKQPKEDLFELLTILNTTFNVPKIQFETSLEGNALDWISEASPRFSHARRWMDLYLTMSPKLFRDNFQDLVRKGVMLTQSLRRHASQIRGEFKIVIESEQQLETLASHLLALEDVLTVANPKLSIMFEQGYADTLIKENLMSALIDKHSYFLHIVDIHLSPRLHEQYKFA